MADDEVPTNMALMAFSDSEVHNDKTCSKTCLKSFETLKTQLDDLRIEFNKSEFNLANYKRGLASVEEQLVFYKKNEVIFCEQLAVLKRDISYKDSEISMLKSELEKLKQEKESNQLKIENFDNASKSLDKLIGSQIPDKSRKGLGFVSYNVVPPPPTGLFSPPNLDLSYSGLEEFQQPEFEGYGPKPSKSVSEDTSNEVKESPDAPLVEELVSDDKLEKKTIFPTVAKIEFVRPKQQEKPVRKPVKYAEMYRSQSPRVLQRNCHTTKKIKAYEDMDAQRHMTGRTCPISQLQEFAEDMLPLWDESQEEKLQPDLMEIQMKDSCVGYSLKSDGPKWLFDIDVLTKSMNYVPVVASYSWIKKDDEGVCKESGIADQKRLKTVLKMDVKSAFLYGKIKEEVYVYQPQEVPDELYGRAHFLLRTAGDAKGRWDFY
ncbi:hypothetical protein Tco_0788492 [Tanacetum coccineum]